MNNEKIRPEIQIIKEAFQEKRNIIDYAPEEMIQVSEYCHNGGDIFITEEGELIDLEYQMKDFDEEELVKYIELAEELYEKNKGEGNENYITSLNMVALYEDCLGKYEKAIEDYKKADEIDNFECMLPFYKVINAYIKLGNYDKATEEIRNEH